MKQLKRSLLVLAASSATALFGCGPGAEQQKDLPVLKIAVSADRTGTFKSAGPGWERGAMYGIDLFNELGGINGTLYEGVAHDNQSVESIAVQQVADSHPTENYFAVISGSGGVSTAIARQFSLPNRIMQCSYGTNQDIGYDAEGKINPFMYSSGSSNGQPAELNAERLTWKMGYTKVAIAYEDNGTTAGLANAFDAKFKSLGGTVTVKLKLSQTLKSTYSAELAQIQTSGAQVVFFAALPDVNRKFISDAVALGYADKFQWRFSHLFGNSNNATDIPAFNGRAMGVRSQTGNGAETDLFTAAATERYGADALPSSNVFDCMMVMGLTHIATGKERPTGDEMKDNWARHQDLTGEKIGPSNLARAKELLLQGKSINYDGANNPMDFAANHMVRLPMTIYAVEGGVLVNKEVVVPD